jgi:antitoxin component YwqK of YwqJK toxin-antitoxin module
LIRRALRIYDSQGRITKEEQIVDDLVKMIPSDTLSRVLERPGVSRPDLRDQLEKLMGGQAGPPSIEYTYDQNGRVAKTIRRVFNREDKIETTYNEHGDIASEITHSREFGTENPGATQTEYSEATYIYHYDDHGNWISQTVWHRDTPDGEFKPSVESVRTLTYF